MTIRHETAATALPAPGWSAWILLLIQQAAARIRATGDVLIREHQQPDNATGPAFELLRVRCLAEVESAFADVERELQRSRP